jgi:hypothetical protein
MLKDRTLEGYECRTEAVYKIADSLGISYERGKQSQQIDKIYRDLSPVFKGEGTLPIGSGKTGRLRQAAYRKLYDFAKSQYDIEIDEWKEATEKKRSHNNDNEENNLVEITSRFLNKLDKGEMNQEEFIGAIRGIVAVKTNTKH